MTSLIDIALKLPVPGQGQARILKDSEARELREEVARITGGRQITQAYVVVAPPGKAIHEHDHPEDVILFYPEDVQVPVVVAGEAKWPKAGEWVLIPAKTMHEVPRNETENDRISVAFKLAT